MRARALAMAAIALALAAGGGDAIAAIGGLPIAAGDGFPPPPPQTDGAGSGDGGNDFTADDIEAIARVIISERGDGSDDEWTWIAWTVRNRARKRRLSPYALESPWGPQGSARPFSSRQAATDASRATARAVLVAPQSDDPTGGATDFWEPGLQDELVRRGALYRSDPSTYASYAKFAGYTQPAADVRASWLADGERVVATVGKLEFLK